MYAVRGLKATSCLILAVLSGCQVWVDVETPQCDSDKACVSLLGKGYTCSSAKICVAPKQEERDAGSMDAGPPLPQRWQCIREEKKEFIPDANKKVMLRMDVVDVAMPTVVPKDLTASACTQGDVECLRPVADHVAPGNDGFLEIPLPHGFEGFVKIEAPGFIPGLSYDNRPYLDSVTTSGPALIQPAVLEVISSNSGLGGDPNLALAFLEVRDCNDAAGDGVSFEPLGDNMPFYFQGQLPSRDLTATMVTPQLGAGREPRAIGGFSSLKQGYTSFKAVLPETGELVTQVTVQTKPGYITYVRMRAGY
ncbi:MAG TPA: hypothetical protein VJR89_13425 [Polyangiales bacterium]|nr:hypothetical protein [Polyangiales bacterium]